MNGKNAQFIAARLADLKRLSSALATEEQAYHERIAAIKNEYANHTAKLLIDLDDAKKQLISFVKSNKKDIFPGNADRVTLPGGVILRQVAAAVRKARHITVEFLRGKGLDSGIRVEESVNWQVIESWPDDQLTRIGTDRKEKETFAYELTEIT